jgi:hypothetical protein
MPLDPGPVPWLISIVMERTRGGRRGVGGPVISDHQHSFRADGRGRLFWSAKFADGGNQHRLLIA